MSDFNNDYNEYNSDPFDVNEHNSDPSTEYNFGGEQIPPKKPKNHTFLKVLAFIVCIGITAAASIQIYKFMDDSKINTTDISDSSRKNDSNSDSENTDSDSEKISGGNEQAVSANENLPSLFELASREDAKSLPDIVDEIMPSVVGVSSTFEVTRPYSSWGWGGFQQETVKEKMVGTGTGVIMTEDGYIVTNAHVVYDESSEYNAGEALEVSVLLSDETEYEAKIVAYDTETDLAVLKVDETGFTPATFGDSDSLRVGELVVAVGNPLGFELFGSVTSGIVSALNREISINEKTMKLIQTDTAINEGNSGGPLLNSCGQVIGINSAKISASYGSASVEGLGFAIPISDAKVIIDDLINYKYVTGRPQIGITAVDITDTYSSYLGLPMGIYVRDVAAGSAAEEAGIRTGDIIIGINDEAVATMEELNAIKNTFKAGDTITLKVNRSGEDIDIQLVLHDANADVKVQKDN